MPESPVGAAADGARQDVVRLAELFRQSFTALDADARAAGRRWAGEISRELGHIGNVDVRADTRKALSDIHSLDRELSRDRALNVGAELPGNGGGLTSAAASELTAAVGGVVGAVSALGGAASQLLGSGGRMDASSLPSPSGSIPAAAGVSDSGSPAMSITQAGSPGGGSAPSASGALSGLGALAEGLSRIGGAGMPGDAAVVPASQRPAFGFPGGVEASAGGPAQSPMPSMGATAPPIAGPASIGGRGGSASQGPSPVSMLAGSGIDSGVSGLGDALNGIRGLTGALPGGDMGSAINAPALPMPPSMGSALSPLGISSANALGTNLGLGAPGAGRPGPTYGNSGTPGMPASAAAAGGTGGAGGQRSGAGVLNLPGLSGEGLGAGTPGGAGGGRGVLTSGRIAMGGDAQGPNAKPGLPSSDPMASAPTSPTDLSSLVPAGLDTNGLAILGGLFPGMAGVTNNQSSATFNINGGGKDPGMDLFMSFWREIGRIGGLVGAVGSFLQ